MTLRGTRRAGKCALYAIALAACTAHEPPKEPVLTADPPLTEGPSAGDGVAQTDVERGLIHLKNEDYVQAKASFKKAISVSPSAVAWTYLGMTCEKTNDRTGAEQAYKSALQVSPGFAEAAQNLGALYLDNPPRPDEAIAVLKPAVEKNPSDQQLLQNLAYAYGLKGDVESAGKAYAQALAKGEDASLRFAWGSLLYENKAIPEAAEQLKKALAAAKTDTALLVSIGRLLGMTKAYAECQEAFDRALKLKSTDPEWYVRRGTCRHELKDEAGAQADYEAALKVDPKFAAGHYYLGLSYLVQKRRMYAIASLDKAAKYGAGTNIGKLAKEKLKALELK